MSSKSIVWLASYPKSGNTWVRLLLGNLLRERPDGEDEEFTPVSGISSNRWLFDMYAGLDSTELTDEEIDLLRPDVYRILAEKFEGLRFIKAHDSYHKNSAGDWLFPPDCSRAAVYLVRDPLDVAVSYAHHRGEDGYDKTAMLLNKPRASIAGTGKEQLRQLLCDWSEHYRSWTGQSQIPVLTVRYEDLSANTAGMLRKIRDFVGIEPGKIGSSIEDAVEASRFERLQKLETEKGFIERSVRSEKFFRSGRSGEGREKLSIDLQKEIIAHHGEVMRELGYLKGTTE